jgi:hypothetical protein
VTERKQRDPAARAGNSTMSQLGTLEGTDEPVMGQDGKLLHA